MTLIKSFFPFTEITGNFQMRFWQKNSLESYFIDSSFRNVKILPIVLKINKFSKGTDLASVLNDIYVLEKQTDLKINEITNENDVLEVKGELYGV